MKSDVVKEAYDNKGNDVTDIQPQPPETKSTFLTNMQILEPSDKMTSSISTVGRVGFLPDEVHEIKMVTLQSRKMRQMSVFLVFFVIISLVMTGLFIWRTVFFDQLHTDDKCKDKICSTSESKKPPPPNPRQPCRYRAKPKPFDKLPKKIADELKFIQESIGNNTLFSLANVVYMDRVIWSNFHGHPRYNHGKKLDEHTLFPVASVSKIFTAVMAFKMYNNRKIDTLDDEIVKYEPKFEIKKRFKSKRPIVIRDILSHMSGLPREAPCYPNTDVNICPYNNTEMLRRISEVYLVMKPGRKPSYSNLGFGLLGQSLPMSLYNLTYEEWMEEHLFKPLGLNDSTYDLAQSNQSKIINGKSLADKLVQPTTWGWLNPTGGLFTSTSDLAKLWISLFKSLDEEDYLSPVIANELFAPAYVFPSTNTLVGVPFEMSVENGYLIRRKNGEVHGYASNVFLVPELKLAFSIMTPQISGHLPSASLFTRLLKAFHDVLGGNATKITLPGNPQAFVGTYEPVHDNTTAPGLSQIQVQQSNDRMILRIIYYGRPMDFPMNYLRNSTFEIWDRLASCMSAFIRGLDLERVYFGTISNETNYLAPGLQIYGVDPRGWTYFKRVK